MRVGAGQLKHRVNIYGSGTTSGGGSSSSQPPVFDEGGAVPPGGAGGPSSASKLIASNVPASIEPARSTDVIKDGQITTQTIIPIMVRWMDNLETDMVVEWKPVMPGRKLKTQRYIVQGIKHGETDFIAVELECIALGENY